MARKEQAGEERDPTEAEQPTAEAPKRRGLFRRRAPAGGPAEGAVANGEPPRDEGARRGKPETEAPPAKKRPDKRRDARGKGPGREGGHGRLALSIVVLFFLLGATLVTLDQVGKIKLPFSIPRFLGKGAPAGVTPESGAPTPEAVASNAESEARRRLDQEETPPPEPTAGGPGAPAEGAAPPPAEGERVRVTESEAALIEGLNVTPPTTTGAGGVTDDEIKAAAKERQRKISRVGVIVSTMKPDVAAKTLEAMPEDRQVAVLRSMEEDKIAKILSAMSPDKSAKLAQALMQ